MELGSIADWVSGLGTVVAIGAAIYAAHKPNRDAQREKARAARAEIQHRALVQAEAIRLAGEIEALAGHFKNRKDRYGGIDAAVLTDTVEEMAGWRRQIEALQTIATPYPRLFTEVGRLAGDARLGNDIFQHASGFWDMTMDDLASRMAERRTLISTLA